LFLCLVCPASCQVGIDSWTADNGLPQNIIRAICQTPDGYLWLATLDGLVRFDGVRFTTFNRSNTAGIRGNRFGSLFCTADGDIWAGTEGSGITQYHRGRFTTYTVQNGLLSSNVHGISGDGKGNLWVLARGCVHQWRPAEGRFVPLDPEEYRYSDPLTPDGRSGFWRIDAKAFHLFVHGKQSHYPLPLGWPRGVSVFAGLDLNKHVWLATQNGRFAHLVDGRWSGAFCNDVRRSACKEKTSIHAEYRDSQGNVWSSEIQIRRPGSNAVQYLDLPPDIKPARIEFNSLFEDREGNIWLATNGQGLIRLHTQTIHVYSKEQGLPDGDIYSVYQSRDRALWLGTWYGGLCQFRDGKFRTYTTADGLASNRIHTIFEDKDGVLWVAVENGLHRMRSGRLELVSGRGIFSRDLVIRAIHQDPKGVMWFGTGEGLIRFQENRCALLTRRDGLATDDVRVIIDGSDGTLWLGGYGGLSSLRGGQVRAWTEEDGLPSNTIRALYEDTDGVLWIGTYDGGLGRFENGRFTKYTIHEGLFNNGVFQILEDSRANLWMSCNRGIYRVSKRQLNDFAAGKKRAITSVAYGKRDGMHNVECNGGLASAGIKAQDGTLWFPTQDGVAVMDPQKLARNLKPPPVHIESCLVDRAPTAIDVPVRIKPGRENVEIQYTALSLIDSERIQFNYKMEGLDHDWVDAGTRRTAYYSHMPPGRYTFRVTAAHGDGVRNETGANLVLVVLPPFYETWWFALLSLTITGASVWLACRYRVVQLKRAQAAQQAFSRRLIASQESERKRISAELHDSLGQRLVIIKNLALLLLQSGDGSGLNGRQRERISEISVEVSGAAREVKEISYNLRPYRLDRLGLTSAVKAMIETASSASATRFSAQIDDIDDAFPKEAEINFYRIVQECVNNILRHSQAAHAMVRIQRAGGRLTMIVRDDGKGFASDFPKSDAPAAGFGLTGISERAQLLGGKAEIQSAPGQGTTVTIEIDRDLNDEQ
jgi:signal transduction histidine kinase/ligand-binding sensor domain-containing protein